MAFAPECFVCSLWMHLNLILFCHILEVLLQFHHQTHLDDTMIYKLRFEATKEYFMWKMIADRDSSFDLIAPRRKNFLYVFMSAVFIPFSLFLSWPFLRIGILLDTTIPGFPQKPVGLLSLCPTEACGLWLTSRCVPTNILEKTKNERKTGRLHLHCPPWTTAVILLFGRLCANLISTNRPLNVQKS